MASGRRRKDRHKGRTAAGRIMAVLVLMLWLASTLPAGAAPALPPDGGADIPPIPNRYLAFGDSITYGHTGMTAYPIRLEATLDVRVAASEVINAGLPAEGTPGGRERIATEVTSTTPAYVLILEGTNDVTRGKTPAEVYENLDGMIDNARAAGVEDMQILLATLTPRLDYLYEETQTMNEEAVWPVAAANHVPVCDLWQAFISKPNWRSLFYDETHPNDAGFQLMADTFYGCLLAFFPEIREDTVPPDAWIEPLPAESECGQVAVSWDGIDNVTWVVDYDVQAQIGDGPWTDWLVATGESGAVFTGGLYGDDLGFRVRGRDLLGNQGEYGEAVRTRVGDSVPPAEAHVRRLPPFQVVPFNTSWWAVDRCAPIAAYDVEYRVGPDGVWHEWLLGTPDSQASFDPDDPQYGHTTYFRVRAQDAAGNWGVPSDPLEAYTTLARYAVAGRVYNLRHRPVAAAHVSLAPPPLWLGPRPGGFLAYLPAVDDVAIAVSREDLYGPLPPMLGLPVSDTVHSPEFILPPKDEAIVDGGFESGSLADWRAGGSLPPSLSAEAHTGLSAVRLGDVGGAGGDSWLAQSVSAPSQGLDLTLSFLVRLGQQEGGPATLVVGLTGSSAPSSTLTYTLDVTGERWSHAWYEVSDWAGRPLTLTFVISGSPAILLDEVSLGSSVPGGTFVYQAAVYRRR